LPRLNGGLNPAVKRNKKSEMKVRNLGCPRNEIFFLSTENIRQIIIWVLLWVTRKTVKNA